jgi:uncharacterized protein
MRALESSSAMFDAYMLWRKLDSTGADTCRLERLLSSRRLTGTVVFDLQGAPACLAYALTCRPDWHSLRGEVSGWIGAKEIDLRLVLAAGQWTINGRTAPGVAGCVDLDLGFTPATNLTQIRRLNLAVGQSAEVRVAWVDVERLSLEPLEQRYERRSNATYYYESPRFGYAGLLEVAPSGFVVRYPGLWQAEP